MGSMFFNHRQDFQLNPSLSCIRVLGSLASLDIVWPSSRTKGGTFDTTMNAQTFLIVPSRCLWTFSSDMKDKKTQTLLFVQSFQSYFGENFSPFLKRSLLTQYSSRYYPDKNGGSVIWGKSNSPFVRTINQTIPCMLLRHPQVITSVHIEAQLGRYNYPDPWERPEARGPTPAEMLRRVPKEKSREQASQSE